MNNEIQYPEGPAIYWEKWVDAYLNEHTEDLHKQLAESNEDEDYEIPFGDEELAEEFSKPIKTIMTPYGILPLTEQSLASSHFKLWVGHTNFKLLDTHYPIIGDCLGVETVDILTPLRFRIGIGKLFPDREVMHTVETVLLGVINESKKQRQGI